MQRKSFVEFDIKKFDINPLNSNKIVLAIYLVGTKLAK